MMHCHFAWACVCHFAWVCIQCRKTPVGFRSNSWSQGGGDLSPHSCCSHKTSRIDHPKPPGEGSTLMAKLRLFEKAQFMTSLTDSLGARFGTWQLRPFLASFRVNGWKMLLTDRRQMSSFWTSPGSVIRTPSSCMMRKYIRPRQGLSSSGQNWSRVSFKCASARFWVITRALSAWFRPCVQPCSSSPNDACSSSFF